MRRTGLVGDDALQRFDRAGEVAKTHLLVAERNAQQRLARLQREAFLDLVAGQLELVLILVHARAMVVDDGGVDGLSRSEVLNWSSASSYRPSMRSVRPATRWTFQSLAADCEQVLDAVAGGFLFAAGEQHVDAVEIGLHRAGIELQGLVEGAASFQHMHLAAQAMARILQMRDAKAGPCRARILDPAARRSRTGRGRG